TRVMRTCLECLVQCACSDGFDDDVRAATARGFKDLLAPIWMGAIVDCDVRPKLPRFRKLLVTRRGDRHTRAGELRELQRHDREPTGPERQYDLTGLDGSEAVEDRPRRDADRA